MTAYLGLDVGGTGARWVVVDAAAGVVARGNVSGATGHLFADAERRRFEAMVAELGASLPAPVAALRAGITGLGDPMHAEARSILAAALRLPPESIGLSDDVVLAFHSVFSPGRGHLVSAGTGAIGLHIAASGEVIRVGGRGILIDDAGSGSWIALRAIDRLYRSIDETQSTASVGPLAQALAAAVGGTGWDHLRQFVYGRDRGTIGALAPAVALAARQGDPIAVGVLQDAVRELARLATALLGQVSGIPVAFVGGVLALDAGLAGELVAALPEADVRFPIADAALTAALLALADHAS